MKSEEEINKKIENIKYWNRYYYDIIDRNIKDNNVHGITQALNKITTNEIELDILNWILKDE